jgi:hypothetical protein
METAIYLKHEDGGNHEYGGKRFAKLRKEILAGGGNDIICDLLCSGYVGYIGRDGDVECLDSLPEHFSSVVS